MSKAQLRPPVIIMAKLKTFNVAKPRAWTANGPPSASGSMTFVVFPFASTRGSGLMYLLGEKNLGAAATCLRRTARRVMPTVQARKPAPAKKRPSCLKDRGPNQVSRDWRRSCKSLCSFSLICFSCCSCCCSSGSCNAREVKFASAGSDGKRHWKPMVGGRGRLGLMHRNKRQTCGGIRKARP
ncbi:hypothetical protein ACKVV1_011593 [Pyricularia oryzae]